MAVWQDAEKKTEPLGDVSCVGCYRRSAESGTAYRKRRGILIEW